MGYFHSKEDDRIVQFFLVMELVEGTSLADALHNNCLNEVEKRKIVGQIVEGMEALHRGRILHCDLHAGNVMVSIP